MDTKPTRTILDLPVAEARLILTGDGHGSRVVLDGTDISHEVTKVVVTQQVGSLPHVEITRLDKSLISRTVRSAHIGLSDPDLDTVTIYPEPTPEGWRP